MFLRSSLRFNEDYSAADAIRSNILQEGYLIQDSQQGSRIRPLMDWENIKDQLINFQSPKDIKCISFNEAKFEITVGVIARNNLDDITRFVTGCLNMAMFKNFELLIVDNSTNIFVHNYLSDLNKEDQRVRVIHLDHNYGEATAKNIILKQSKG